MSGVRSSSTLRRLRIASSKRPCWRLTTPLSQAQVQRGYPSSFWSCAARCKAATASSSPAFGVVDASQIQRAVPAIQLFDLRKCFCRLPQFAPCPSAADRCRSRSTVARRGSRAVRIVDVSLDTCHRKRHAVGRQSRDRQLVLIRLARLVHRGWSGPTSSIAVRPTKSMYCWSNLRYCSFTSTVTGSCDVFGKHAVRSARSGPHPAESGDCRAA